MRKIGKWSESFEESVDDSRWNDKEEEEEEKKLVIQVHEGGGEAQIEDRKDSLQAVFATTIYGIMNCTLS